MRHSERDKRAKRNRPRQCLADYGHNVHKDAPSLKKEAEWIKKLDPLELPLQAVPLAEWLKALARQKAVGWDNFFRTECDLL
jgi:hypothetical protein